MAIAPGTVSTLTASKPGAISVNGASITLAAGTRAIVFVTWLGSVAQTMTLTEASGNIDIVKVGQRQSSGLTGVAAWIVSAKPGNAGTVSGVSTFAVNTGTITSIGAGYLTLTGAGHDVEISMTGADSASATSSAPTATSGALAVGDLVFALVGANGPSGDTFTQDTDTTGGSWSPASASAQIGSTGAGATTNATSKFGYKVVTASGTQTYNPALGTARNYAEITFGLKVVTAVSATADTGSGADASTLVAKPTGTEFQGSTTGSQQNYATAGSDLGGAHPWANPGNITNSDAVDASVTVNNATSNVIEATVPPTGIPANSVITGVTVFIGADTMTNLMAWSSAFAKIGASTGRDMAGEGIPSPGTNTFGGAGDLLGLSAADWAAFVAGTNLLFDLAVTSPTALNRTAAIDYINIQFDWSLTGSDSSETGSVVIGGGTPKSGTDVNGTTTEAATETVIETGTDSGSNTSSITLLALHGDSDADTAVVENFNISQIAADADTAVVEDFKVSQTATDTDTAVTETGVPLGVHATSDANSATTEATRISQIASDSGTDSENGAYSQALLGTDSGSGSEAVVEIAITTATDTGTDTEASTLAVAVLVSDTGTDTEAITLKAAISVSDTGTDTETSVAAVPVSGSDSGSDSESSTLAAAISSTQTGTNSDIGSLAATGSASDIGSGTETGTEVAVISTGADTGASNEIATEKAAFSASDSGTDSEAGNAVPTSATNLSAQDTGQGSESASEAVALGGSTEAGSGVESGSGAALYVLGDSGTSLQIAALAAVMVAAQAGTAIDISSIAVKLISQDSAAAFEAALISLLVHDFGYAIDAESLHLIVSDVDSGVGLEESIKKRWPGVPITPAELISATEMASAVLVGAKETGTGISTTVPEKPALNSASGQKPQLGKTSVKPLLKKVD